MPDAELEIKPRKQFRDFVLDDKRWSALVVHRRGGKTFSSLQKLLYRALTHQRKGPPKRYAYIAPTREQAKDIAWSYLKSFTHGLPGVTINESELKLTFEDKNPDGTAGPNDGMVIRLYSGDAYERMRGIYFDGVIIDEPEDIDPQAWPMVIRPCLSDYNGWAVWIGTIKGKRGQWARFVKASQDPKWFSLLLRASESGIIPEDELEDIKDTSSEDAFEQEYECNPNIGRPGAIYAKEVAAAEAEGRVRDFQPDGGAPVHTAWDLGSPENTVVTYFQRVGPFLYIIDCDAGLRMTTGERIAHMNAKGYTYGTHCLPHDAKQTRPGGMSYIEELESSGLKGCAVIPVTVDPERRINRMWEMFPNIYFHKERTANLLEALDAYHRKEITKTAEITSKIVHDWASHYADSFGYIAEAEAAGIIETSVGRRVSGPKAKPAVTKKIRVIEDDEFDDEPAIKVTLGSKRNGRVRVRK